MKLYFNTTSSLSSFKGEYCFKNTKRFTFTSTKKTLVLFGAGVITVHDEIEHDTVHIDF